MSLLRQNSLSKYIPESKAAVKIPPASKQGRRRLDLYGGLFLFLLIAICWIGWPASDCMAEMVSINAEKVNMRKGPGKRYKVIWQLGKGFPLIKLGHKGKWFKVKDFEGDVGWVYGPLTAKKPHLIVKVGRVNIRSGPGRKYPPVSLANYGVVFRTLNRKGGLNGWVKVRHEAGVTGWIKRKLLWGW